MFMFQLTCITSPFPVKVILLRLPHWSASNVNVYVGSKRTVNVYEGFGTEGCTKQ